MLNREDPDWYWIVRSDGQEGFIPSGFVYPADNVIQGKQLFIKSQISIFIELALKSNSHHHTT